MSDWIASKICEVSFVINCRKSDAIIKHRLSLADAWFYIAIVEGVYFECCVVQLERLKCRAPDKKE